MKADYTPKVKRLADDVRKFWKNLDDLTMGERLALRELLEDEQGLPPDGAGVREPRKPKPTPPGVEAKVDAEGWPARWSDPTYLGDGPWGA